MMPQPPGGSMMGPAGPTGGPPAGGPGGAPGGAQKEQIKATLVRVLTQAKRIAEQNGINFEEIVAQAAGQGRAAMPPPPIR